MPASTEIAPVPTRLPTREALLRKPRGWFFGMTGDQFIKYVFQGNAAISIVVLGLITFTIFSDAIGFLPQNQANLVLYRRAGLEYVDLLRAQVASHSAISRYLSDIRARELARLTKVQGLAPAAAVTQLAGFDDFANRFADTLNEQETILGNMTDLVSALKERQKVSEDMAESKRNLLGGMGRATPEHAAELQKQADATQVEVIDFKEEIKPLRAMQPEVFAANARQIEAMKVLAANPPKLADPALARKLDKFQDFVRGYFAEVKTTEQKMVAWDQTKPIGFFASFNAFAFGREWVTASFWQDWYGIVPLLTGSLIIAFLALLIAIPLGIASAVYVNQVAKPVEQRFIKPYIEFISAIPSVVLGFFGIAMLGETLRRVSQVEWLSWFPGFPMAEAP
ncbi:MAG: phosphate ABC transporter permease subunit PstC [Lacunisphaera sp.]